MEKYEVLLVLTSTSKTEIVVLSQKNKTFTYLEVAGNERNYHSVPQTQDHLS